MTTTNTYLITKDVASGSRHKIFEIFKTLKLSFDALERLCRPERGEFLGTVSNNSFKKVSF